MSVEKLLATKAMHPPKLVQRLFDWYFTRIYVHVRPERVYVWPERDFAREPVPEDGGWAIVPRKLVGGFELPASSLQRYRINARKMLRFRRIAKRRLAKRPNTA